MMTCWQLARASSSPTFCALRTEVMMLMMNLEL
jgi:hypothetical protein